MHRAPIRTMSSQVVLVIGLAVSAGLGAVLAQQPPGAPAATSAQTPAAGQPAAMPVEKIEVWPCRRGSRFVRARVSR